MLYGMVVKLRSMNIFTVKLYSMVFPQHFFNLDQFYGLTASFPEKEKEQLNYTCEVQCCISSYENFLFRLFSSPPNLAFSLPPLLFQHTPDGIVTLIRPQLLYITPFPIHFIPASLSFNAIQNVL